MTNPPLEILYESGPCLVVLKPAGISTQAPPGIESLEVRLKELLKARDNLLGKVYLGVPHRLDRPVSGVMVFARHTRATRRLARQFEERTVRKVYWALVEGRVEPAEGTWTDFMRKIPDVAKGEIVAADHSEARRAELHYRTLGGWEKMGTGSWLEIQPITGRMHQIRVQAASRGYPILGDAVYGSTIPFGPQHDDPRQRAIGLHAYSLTFRHPMTKEVVTIAARPDWEMKLGALAE